MLPKSFIFYTCKSFSLTVETYLAIVYLKRSRGWLVVKLTASRRNRLDRLHSQARSVHSIVSVSTGSRLHSHSATAHLAQLYVYNYYMT